MVNIIGASGCMPPISQQIDRNYLIINSTNDRGAYVFTVPKTGTIQRVGLVTMNCANTLPLIGEFREVNTTTLKPTAALKYPNGTGSINLVSNTTIWMPINSGNGVSVTRGDKVAFVIYMASTTGTNNIELGNNYVMTITTNRQNYPTVMQTTNAETSWTVLANPPAITLQYTDGVVSPQGASTPCRDNTVTFSTSTTPSVIGTRFYLPYDCEIGGAWSAISINSQISVDLVLFDSDGVTQLASSRVTNPYGTAIDQGIQRVQFTTPVVLKRGVYYRLAVVPTSTSGSVVRVISQDACPGFLPLNDGDFYPFFRYTTSNGLPVNEASWTNYTDRYPKIGLYIDAIVTGLTPAENSLNGGLA